VEGLLCPCSVLPNQWWIFSFDFVLGGVSPSGCTEADALGYKLVGVSTGLKPGCDFLAA
jgi:hypothetical protein